MSFSGMVKEELSRQIGVARHCKAAELSSLLCACGRIKPDGTLSFQMENDSVVRKYFTLLQKTFNIETVITVKEGSYAKKGYTYQVEIRDPEEIAMILSATKLEQDENRDTLSLANTLAIQNACCKRAFIRGAFLAAGSMSDPEKSYHFEIVSPEETKARQLQSVIRSFDIDAKIVQRKKSYVVYVKEGAQIVDLLAVMEAGNSLMNLENIRIVKEIKNSINRKVNCEAANISKTVEAAVKQKTDIELIRDRIGFDSLSEGLAEVAELRLQYPEAALKELGMMLTPQVGKSGVNHRLRKLSQIAEELRRNEEDLL
ncbi:MAG: DNA-binding protein WhiA [Clostridiales bacterium]|nr:DNA-binding protein WhiA [Candidatus Blautia equi]